MPKILFHPMTAVLIVVAAVAFFLSLDSTSKRAQVTIAEAEKLADGVADLNQDVEKLKLDLTEATSAASVEERIRDELLLQLPGEIVLQVPDLPPPQDWRPTPTPTQPNWKQWWRAVVD